MKGKVVECVRLVGVGNVHILGKNRCLVYRRYGGNWTRLKETNGSLYDRSGAAVVVS